MEQNLENIFSEAKKYIDDPDYIIDLVDLTFIYIKKEVTDTLQVPASKIVNHSLFELLDLYNPSQLLSDIWNRRDEEDRYIRLKSSIPSPIDKVRFKTVTFKFNDSQYRVGKILEYVPKSK
jgi:hypothetical protein